MIDRFRFLKVSLAMVLAIVGLKMLLAEPLKAALGPAFNIYLLLVAANRSRILGGLGRRSAPAMSDMEDLHDIAFYRKEDSVDVRLAAVQKLAHLHRRPSTFRQPRNNVREGSTAR